MKQHIISIIILSLFFISGCNENIPSTKIENTNEMVGNSQDNINLGINKELFSTIAIEEMYNQGFCYEGMEAEGISCGEAEYPFVRIFYAEDYSETGKILLVTKVTERLYEEIPELYDKTITFVFRDANQQTIDKIYVEKNEWGR